WLYPETRPTKGAAGLVGIPSLPVSQANAELIARSGQLPDAPCALAAEVEMAVEQDPALVGIEDVLGWIEGSTRPDEWVIAGAHRDAWGFGAVDNGSGSAVLLETARVLGAALGRGWRPERTLVLATWDAEEWGLVGSTEWVEQHRRQLAAGGVAYLNMDVVASGASFGASCTPGMAELLRQCCADAQVEPPQELGVPGGGSDHVPFLELAGMEVAAFGFHGGHGTYHSTYDTPFVVERFLDPDFAHHAAAADLLVRLLDRLSAAELRLDGLAGWSRQALAAAAELPLPDAQRERLLAAAQELVAAAEAVGAELPHPQRFLRFFLPAEEGGRLLLWRTAGYGASWFPEVRSVAEGAGSDPGTEAAISALRRAARTLRYAKAPAGQ
ncbi:MAG: M28 family peptidase, partial [Planctomycetes bacterium]|nr:M28 family peptidase [Planctomycetota bacterium]